MIYFNHGYIEFLEQLNLHNNRDWFRKNKKWYELAVREPFKELVADLLPEIQKIDPDIKMEPKDALFRINRDMRFSKYQHPYKAHMAAGFTRSGRKSSLAGYYLQIGRKLTAIGGGLPYLDREILRKIRIEIGYNPEKFYSVLSEPEFQYLYGGVLGENDTELAKSFKEIANTLPIISKKQFYYTAFYKTEDVILKNDFVEFIIKHFMAGYPLNNFLINAVSNFTKPIPKRSPRKVLEI